MKLLDKWGRVDYLLPHLLLPMLIAFVISVILLKIFIPILRKVKLGQKILEIGPSWHKCKEGTPVLGGLFFLFPMLLVFAGYCLWRGIGLVNKGLIPVFILSLSSALIGFIDDYVKLFKKRNKGLTAKQKLVLQFLSAGAFLFARAKLCDGTHPWYYYAIMLVVVVYVINCANLTDGIDGLAGSIALIVCLFFALVADGVLVDAKFVDARWASPLCMSLIGGLLGFLVFNFHPAKIFMGDTGSLFLGGFITAMAFHLHMELLLVPICFVWIVEGISVMLQVGSFKLTGKRIFKMAPLHHHFEMCGWSEVRIVFVFSLATALCCAIAYYFIPYVCF